MTLYGKLSKFCSDSCVKISWNLADWKSVKSCVATWQKHKILPDSPAVATARIAPKICHGQHPTMYSECSRFYPIRFTFCEVIAERVNIAKTRHKVNTIFDWSPALSRIISLPYNYVFRCYWDTARYWSKIVHLDLSHCVYPFWNFARIFWARKLLSRHLAAHHRNTVKIIKHNVHVYKHIRRK